MDNIAVPAENLSGNYFKGVPFAMMLVFGWFFYGAVSSTVELVRDLFMLLSWFASPLQMLLFLIPLGSLVLSAAVVWGLYKQAFWTKPVVAVWYVAVLVYFGYSIYPILSSVGFDSMNRFYSQSGISPYVWITLVPTVVVFGINTLVVYYIFKKAALNNH